MSAASGLGPQPAATVAPRSAAVAGSEGPVTRRWAFRWHLAPPVPEFGEPDAHHPGDAGPPPGVRAPAAVLLDIGLTVIHPSGERMLADARAEASGFDAAPHHLVAALLLAAEARHLPLPLGLDGAGKVAVAWGALVGLPAEASLRVWQRMMAREDLYCELDPEAVDLFEGLRRRGIRVAAVSNSDGTLRAELRHFGLERYFDAVIDSTAVSAQKPAPAIYRAAFDALSVTAGECWFVGDGLVNDVLGAQCAGASLGVLYDRFGVYRHLPTVPRISRLTRLHAWLDQAAVRERAGGEYPP